MQRRYEPFKEVFVYVEGESYKICSQTNKHYLYEKKHVKNKYTVATGYNEQKVKLMRHFIEYIHNKNLVHHDLKTDNIFFLQKNNSEFCDKMTELIEQMTIESPQASLKSEMFNMSTSELRRLAGKES
ncbi:hypothetical protein RIR_jg33461.t1 [Rhizophagus irregularis DAOM 181602=DAOM 197198]|nr:hypothetical protein RIR_jg33461.t1 [Rhizophagus irregularis DAOM 181602=DAOM 197198]